MGKPNRISAGSIQIKLSPSSRLIVHYHIDNEDGIWYDNDGGGLPSYSAIIIDSVYYNDIDIIDLVNDFRPIEEYIIEKIRDEY